MKKLVILLILIVIGFALFWFFYPLRSYVVMSIYSASHAKDSVMQQNNFKIDMPSGEGWYPFVMTYNAEGFRKYTGLEADMSIMYNFGAFDLGKRTSTIYDKASDKYSSFYGAYVVQEKEHTFGFNEDGSVDIDAISLAVKYDYAKLVIRDFGCEEQTYSIDGVTTEPNLSFIGSDGWTRIDAVLTVNGAAHNYNGYKTPYLQYGRPMEKVEKDFEVTNLYGRVYAKYFNEYGCTVMVYVIAPSLEAVDTCDENILKETIIAPLS